MKRAVLLTLAVLAACSTLSDSTWFTITGIALPGDTQGTGTITVNLATASSVVADLHLRNGGSSPGTKQGTGIRGFTVTMDYRFPGTSLSLPGFTQTVIGYLPAPVDGEASTTVLGGVALLTADRLAVMKGWGVSPFTVQIDFTVSGETDDGATVVTAGGVALTVVNEAVEAAGPAASGNTMAVKTLGRAE